MTDTLSHRLAPDAHLSHLVRQHALPFSGDKRELDPLMDLIGDASFVLIGEASHGTHEFYKTRIDLTTRLIEERQFNVVAAEADWTHLVHSNASREGSGAMRMFCPLSNG